MRRLLGALIVYLFLGPGQVAEGQTDVSIMNQPSSSPDTTCGYWYSATGSCAYYTFNCDYSLVQNPDGSMVDCEVCDNPVDTWPTCFTGTLQSPVHLNRDEATVAPVDPGSITFTGYSNPLNPVLRAQGYVLQLDQEATMRQMGPARTRSTTAPARDYDGDNKEVKLQNRIQQLRQRIRQLRPNKGKKRKNKHWKRGKRQFGDWGSLFFGRQAASEDPPSITGGPLSTDRFLFHHTSWHWGDDSSRGSEHHLNSRQFPAEIQLFHYNSDAYNSYENALGKPKGVVALSFFYELSSTDNADLEIIWQNIKLLDGLLKNMGMEFEQAVPGLQLNELLPSGGVGSSDSYYYYSGSLTQPGNNSAGSITDCSESVQWINYEKTIPISETQLATLRALLSTINLKQQEIYNFRPTCSSNFRPLHQLNPSQTARAPSPVVGRRKARQAPTPGQLFFRPNPGISPVTVLIGTVGGIIAANLPALLNPGAPPPPSQADLPQPSAESANTAETTDLTEAFPQIGAENGFCLTQGVCEPLIESALGLYSVTSVTAVNLALIENINSRSLGWTAGQTSLFGESFASVLAYRMGELPPSTFDRSGQRNRNNTLKFLQEIEGKTKKDRPIEWTVYTTDSRNQGVCSSCAAFAVTAAFETCMQQTGNSPGVSGVPPPTGLSSQNLLDCAFNTAGLAGCDGGQSFRYLQWLTGGGLDTAYSWPYKDGAKKFEVPLNASIKEAYGRRPGGQRCTNQPKPKVILDRSIISWDDHTQTDIENILLDGHAVITTMEVTQEFQHYTSGIFYNDKCDNWYLGSYRDYQWNTTYGLRPLRHAVVIVGFGVDSATGVQFWKVKNSWGPLWGESGFFRILKGYGHCGIGAYISVATCKACPRGGCQGPRPVTNTVPPANLPDEEVFLGQTTFLASPVVAQGQLTCEESECESECSSLQPCRVFCGTQCVANGGTRGQQCCKPLGGRAQRLYCPRRGALCAN